MDDSGRPRRGAIPLPWALVVFGFGILVVLILQELPVTGCIAQGGKATCVGNADGDRTAKALFALAAGISILTGLVLGLMRARRD